VRPTSGLEIVSSRHFPDEVQGDIIYANAIGFLGIKQVKIQDEGTGWKTEQNVYGMPGKWFSFMALFSVLAQFIPSLFLKRANLLFMALNLAYAVFTFVKYNRSYGIITPTIQYGSWIMVLASLVLMFAALFPSGTLKPATGEQKI
jgi:hypothetical protein